MAARADDALGIEEQHDLLAQARELGIRVDRKERQRLERLAPQPFRDRLRAQDPLAGASAVRGEHGPCGLLGVARRLRRRHRTASAVPSSRSASCSGSASTSRSCRVIARLRTPASSSVSARLVEFVLGPRDHVAELLELGLDRRRARATLRCCAARSPACESPSCRLLSSARKLVGPHEHDAVVALQLLGKARPRHHFGVQALGRHEQDREVGGERRRRRTWRGSSSLRRAGARPAPCAHRRPRACPRARAHPAGAATRRAGTWRRPAASTAASRCRVPAGGSRTRRGCRCPESSRRWSRTAAASATSAAAPPAGPRPTCRASSRWRARASNRPRRWRATASRPGRDAPAPADRTRA